MMNDMPEQSWKAISGFPDYELSPLGVVRSRKGRSVRMLRTKWARGYAITSLRRDGRTYYPRLARLVLDTFVGPCPHRQRVGPSKWRQKG